MAKSCSRSTDHADDDTAGPAALAQIKLSLFDFTDGKRLFRLRLPTARVPHPSETG